VSGILQGLSVAGKAKGTKRLSLAGLAEEVADTPPWRKIAMGAFLANVRKCLVFPEGKGAGLSGKRERQFPFAG